MIYLFIRKLFDSHESSILLLKEKKVYLNTFVAIESCKE